VYRLPLDDGNYKLCVTLIPGGAKNVLNIRMRYAASYCSEEILKIGQ